MTNLQKNPTYKTIILIALLCTAVFCLFMLLCTSNSTSDNVGNIKNPVSTEIVTNTVLTDGGIIYDAIFKNDNVMKPIAIIQHGLTGNRKDCSYMAMELAVQGFYVICPDAYGHGDSKSTKILSVPEIVVQTSKNVDIILKQLNHNEQLDFNHIYFAGFSLGALTAYHYGSYGDYFLTAIAACCGTPDFSEMIGKDIIYNDFSYGDWNDITDKNDMTKIDEFLNKNNPINNMQKLYKINLLIQIGEMDTTIPAEGSYKLYNELKQTLDYAQPTLTKYPSQNHEFTESNLREIIEYFIKIKE